LFGPDNKSFSQWPGTARPMEPNSVQTGENIGPLPRFPATTIRLDSYIAFMDEPLNHARIPMPSCAFPDDREFRRDKETEP